MGHYIDNIADIRYIGIVSYRRLKYRKPGLIIRLGTLVAQYPFTAAPVVFINSPQRKIIWK